jgi:predicted branched-subunit amino acid permease
MSQDPRDEARAGVWRQALSVAIATGAYGISFGAVGVSAGLSVAQTCALSLLMFTGGSQFAFAGVAASGGGPLTAVTTAALVGARNGFYGLQMAPLLRTRGLRRLLAVQLTIDESTAVGSAQTVTHPDRPELARLGFWATGGGVFILWNAATALGAIIGEVLGDPRRYGFDAAAAAAFLALLWPRLRDADARWIGLAAAVVALGAVPVVPGGVPVLAAGTVALAAAWWAARPSRLPGQAKSGPVGPGPLGPGPLGSGQAESGPVGPGQAESGQAESGPASQ